MKPVLSIREITTDDISHILAYWRDVSDEDLARLGELERPNEEENFKFLKWFCEVKHTIEQAGEDIVIWEANGRAIAYSTLKQFRIPDYGQLHLHMWAKDLRGKGYGAVLFCLSALHFRVKYQIRNLFCRPKADNLMPNRMLVKIGFSTTNSDECLEREYPDGRFVKHIKYHITDDVIYKYLAKVAEKFEFTTLSPTIAPLETFETERLIARRLVSSDFSILHAMNENTEVMATLGGICNEEETSKRLAWNLNQWTTHGFGLCFFFDKVTNEFVGRGGIRRLEIDGIEEVEVAYALVPQSWGKGLATEIAKKCIEIGFGYYKVPSLVAGTQTTNKKSQRVIEKSGFVFRKGNYPIWTPTSYLPKKTILHCRNGVVARSSVSRR